MSGGVAGTAVGTVRSLSLSETINTDNVEFQEGRLANLATELDGIIKDISSKRIFTLAAENSALKQVNVELSQGVDELLTSELASRTTLERTLTSHVTPMTDFLAQLPPLIALTAGPPPSPTAST
jgi:hypothetical protein